MMKWLTSFLKLVLVGLKLGVLLLCVLAFPALLKKLGVIYPQYVVERLLFMTSLYTSAILFYVAGINAYRILNLINQHNVFSATTINAIARIKKMILGMGICYTLFLPFIYRVADSEDAPGLVLMFGVVALVPYVVSVFAAILEKLAKQVVL
ncbi:hypothetical protein HMPREF0497_0884 [Lentilactobacillus buchneri ATCC 11577]|uniref:DUF2975 domain-containing protein n=1 Tax=Lentilactobacillus hilgardii TaxID=1588 RepID=UPI00019C4897|nr:DUF2975 domain-containing protein [Lentilactobacillus hilgardii]EEI20315.1 hypothetical protein HMPREF0497_0884 [Lentilactobacillus buchneri ATCC 11577]